MRDIHTLSLLHICLDKIVIVFLFCNIKPFDGFRVGILPTKIFEHLEIVLLCLGGSPLSKVLIWLSPWLEILVVGDTAVFGIVEDLL